MVTTVQLTSKLTLACGEHMCVLQFCCISSQNTRVTRNGLHASQFLCTACKLFFVCCTQIIIRVMHDSKKHVSNASCAACESVFLCAACKLIAVFCQRRIKQNVIKCVDTKKIIFSQAFMYPYSR